MMECGLRWAVEARRRGRGTQKEQPGGQEQDEKVSFREEEQSDVTDDQNVMSGPEEVRTGRGCAGLVQGDESCKLNETKGKGKGKGNGGKGEHASNGGEFGGKGFARMTKGDDEEDERVQVALDMGACGSYLQATLDPEEGEAEEGKRGTRRVRWADCDDNEEEGRQEAAEEMEMRERERGARRKRERGMEAQREESEERTKRARKWRGERGGRRDTGQEKTTDEKPPGLEDVESETKTQEEEQPCQVESEQEARREEQVTAQEAREEEQRRAQEAREREAKAWEVEVGS